MSTVRPPSQLNQVYRFGEFEFSVRAGELRRNSEVLRLQYQPLRVLLALLEYSGEVITREEMRERVWPDDNVRDLDNCLRVAVTKLRQALGDDPDNPQFIETLPRRGYRWLYPVTIHETQANGVEPDLAAATVVTDSSRGPIPASALTSISLKPSRHAKLLRSILLTLAVCAATVAVFRSLRLQPDDPNPEVLPLTTYAGLEYMPALSPDGKRVAFAWTGPNASDPYRVYMKRIGDDGAQPITGTPAGATDGAPVWSTDGKSILFYRRSGEDSGIYQAPAEGGAARLLTLVSLHGTPVKRGRFDISPDGKTVVYPSRLAGQQQVALFLLDLATSQSRQLTFPPPDPDGDSDPAYSHDGKSIVFERDTLDLQQVYVIPAAGGNARRLTDHNRTDIDGLAWTRDDSEILLGGQQLRRLSSSDSGQPPTIVPYLPAKVIFPVLRGSLLAYSQAWDNANIWKLDLRDASHAAGEPVKLIASTRQQAAASFSPDGKQIAFQSDRSGNWEIWKSNRDGSNAVQLTHFNGPLTGTPRWSPDGKQIAFDSRGADVSEIYLVPAEGGAPRRATSSTTGNEVPAWSRDGKWLYYSSNRDGITNVWKMPLSGGTEQRVTANGGIYAVESYDGEYLYYSRSATDPTIWRVSTKGGAEEPVPGAPKPFGCSHWAISPDGFYIADPSGDLIFYDFAPQKAAKVIHHAGLVTDWSLTVSPDGHEVVWAQVDSRTADLMLVENFR